MIFSKHQIYCTAEFWISVSKTLTVTLISRLNLVGNNDGLHSTSPPVHASFV